MKSIRSFKAVLALLGLVGAFLSTNLAHAQLSYLVDINTSSIVNNASGPFYLDFQSLFGSGSAQTVTLSNFSITGGGFIPGTDSVTGAVSGSTAGSLVFNPNSGSFYNEFFQQFDATVSNIQFTLNLTTNVSGVTPTSFAVAILDNGLLNIPTTGVGDSLLLFNIDGASTDFQTGTGLGVTLGVTPIPEPSTYGLFAGVSMIAGVLYLRRRRTAA